MFDVEVTSEYETRVKPNENSSETLLKKDLFIYPTTIDIIDNPSSIVPSVHILMWITLKDI